MISDKERREVAERLRVYSHDFDFSDSDPFWYVSKAAFGDVDVHTYCSAFARLADLIDRPTTTRHGKFRTKYGRETPCCEVCGYSIGDMRWGYCPKCGAVITDD